MRSGSPLFDVVCDQGVVDRGEELGDFVFERVKKSCGTFVALLFKAWGELLEDDERGPACVLGAEVANAGMALGSLIDNHVVEGRGCR